MSLSPWIMAARPRTLGLSVTPVVVGTALAWAAARQIHVPAAFAALIGSVCIQLGTNLHNDVVDSERGGDGPGRLGPLRVTASGLLSPASVRRAAFACFAASAAVGLYLVSVGGWPILILGILSIASGLAYNGGPLPIAYTPLGEIFVILFFGVGAVCGTYWLCTAHLDARAVSAALALGFWAAAVLMVNNYRDVESDARIGRRTLAIVVGPQVSVWIYAGLTLAPFALLPAIGQGLPRGHWWPALGALPFALVQICRFAREPRGRGFNAILVRTVQTQILFALLLALGLVL